MTPKSTIKTLVIDNFGGALTRETIGDLNSGLAKYDTSFGYDPFSNPTSLTWMEQVQQIDSTAAVITDLIVAQKPHLESGVTYVYAVGHTGRVYKIQVNNTSTHNPNYDTPVLLTTLAIGSPTFKYGSSIDFFDSVGRIYIGHDLGITRLNFDGTGEAAVSGSYSTVTTPRPSAQFLGKIYFGNGTNILEIDSTSTVTSSTKLSPGFPFGSFVRDLDVTPDGNYLKITVALIPAADMTVTTQDTNALSSTNSYLFLWNGTDTGYTSYTTFNSHSLTSNISFNAHNYTLGYDTSGAAMYSADEKLLTLPSLRSPDFGATFSSGNMVFFAAPEKFNSGTYLAGSLLAYGQYDYLYKESLYRLFLNATANIGGFGYEVLRIPTAIIVSNLLYGSSISSYSGAIVGTPKIYFSLIGAATSGGTAGYGLFKFNIYPTGLVASQAGNYETQTQVFSKKVSVKEVRIYSAGWAAGNDFTVSVIGSAGTTLVSKEFIQGTNLTTGQDFAWFDPATAPTYAIAIAITNNTGTNFVIQKIEVDIDELGGK